MKILQKIALISIVLSSCTHERYYWGIHEDYHIAAKIMDEQDKKLAKKGLIWDGEQPKGRHYELPQPFLCADYYSQKHCFTNIDQARDFYLDVYVDYAKSLEKDPIIQRYLQGKSVGGDVLSITLRCYERYCDEIAELRRHPTIAVISTEQNNIVYKTWKHYNSDPEIFYSEPIDEVLVRYYQNKLAKKL